MLFPTHVLSAQGKGLHTTTYNNYYLNIVNMMVQVAVLFLLLTF